MGFILTIITADGHVLTKEVAEVVVQPLPPEEQYGHEVDGMVLNSLTGALGILENHAPLSTGLDIGIVRYRTKDSEKWTPYVNGFGSCRVTDEGNVIVLVIKAEKIDPKDKEKHKQELIEAMKNLNQAGNLPPEDLPLLKAGIQLRYAQLRVEAHTFL